MNFMPATVKGDKVELPFVTVDLPEHVRDGRIPEDTLLIAGIRPEYFEDVSVMDAGKAGDGATFRATIDVVEWLGNEAFGYIPYDAPPEVESQLEELAKELDSEALRTQIIVALDSASRIRDGEEAELHVDSRRMHLFEPVVGRQPHPPHRERRRAQRGGLSPVASVLAEEALLGQAGEHRGHVRVHRGRVADLVAGLLRERVAMAEHLVEQLGRLAPRPQLLAARARWWARRPSAATGTPSRPRAPGRPRGARARRRRPRCR